MTMHDAVDVRIALVYLAVDVALNVAWLRALLNSIRRIDVILDKIIW